MITFSDTENKVSDVQIAELESLVGLDFPQEYKQHLLKNNGGRCTPDTFEFIENEITTQSNVDWFLAIYDGIHDNLKDYIETYKIEEKRLPSNVLPIAHDPGGNLICISCNGDDKGFVYFWNHEGEIEKPLFNDRDYSNLYLIAKSFNEFLESLK